MNYSRSAFDSHPYNDFYQTSDARTEPLSSSVPALLTASVVLLAIDATMHFIRWRSRVESPFPADATPRQAYPPLSELVAKADKVLLDFQELEKQLSPQPKRRRTSLPSAEPRSTHQLTISSGDRGDVCQGLQLVDGFRRDHTSSAFASFCERLLLMNRIWEQDKQIKKMHVTLKSKSKDKQDTAFKTFCDQLLLWNRIWKLEKEVKLLVADGEKMKRSRVAAITRAAKRMVLDVQKDRLVEEFAKDLIKEVEDGKQEIEGLRSEHERDLAEVNGDWVKDYRRISRELDALKLAHKAHLAEQELANEIEQSMYESLQAGMRKVEALEEKVSAYEQQGYVSSDVTRVEFDLHMRSPPESCDDDRTDVELDTLSELSSSSTCVSFDHVNSRATKPMVANPGMERKRRASQPTRPSYHGISTHYPLDRTYFYKSSLPSTSAAAKGDLLSLKPLIVDRTDAVSSATRICNHSGRPLAIRNRTASVSSKGFLVSNVGGSAPTARGIDGLAKKVRAPWRV